MKTNLLSAGRLIESTPPVIHAEKRRARVLHVENNKYVFRAIKRLMSLYQFAAIHNVHCPDLSAAEVALKSNRHFDLIITDHDPPALDCAELIDLVRSLDHREDTPVLVLASVLEDGRPEAASGAEAFFGKPPNFEEFKRTVGRLLNLTFTCKPGVNQTQPAPAVTPRS